jgi:hypothetical protein
MPTFIEEILDDIDWRVAELATIKSIPFKYGFNENHRTVHIKYSVPAIYSIWEGFVKAAFISYLTHLSKLKIKRNDISLNLLTHYIDCCCKLHNPRQNFDTKRKVVQELDILFVDTIELIPEVPTESNVNFKVLKGLLTRFCIDVVDGKYEKGLDRLLFFRNKIAHGENALRVEIKDVNDFIKLVEDLMLDVVINIQSCESKRTYLKVQDVANEGRL